MLVMEKVTDVIGTGVLPVFVTVKSTDRGGAPGYKAETPWPPVELHRRDPEPRLIVDGPVPD